MCLNLFFFYVRILSVFFGLDCFVLFCFVLFYRFKSRVVGLFLVFTNFTIANLYKNHIDSWRKYTLGKYFSCIH